MNATREGERGDTNDTGGRYIKRGRKNDVRGRRGTKHRSGGLFGAPQFFWGGGKRAGEE